MFSPNLIYRNTAISFLQYPNNLGFCKSWLFHLNLQPKSCQEVLLFACLINGGAYDVIPDVLGASVDGRSTSQIVENMAEEPPLDAEIQVSNVITLYFEIGFQEAP